MRICKDYMPEMTELSPNPSLCLLVGTEKGGTGMNEGPILKVSHLKTYFGSKGGLFSQRKGC